MTIMFYKVCSSKEQTRKTVLENRNQTDRDDLWSWLMTSITGELWPCFFHSHCPRAIMSGRVFNPRRDQSNRSCDANLFTVLGRLNADWDFCGKACICSVFVSFSNVHKTVSHVIAFRNSYLVKSVNSVFTHVLFQSVYDAAASNVKVNRPELCFQRSSTPEQINLRVISSQTGLMPSAVKKRSHWFKSSRQTQIPPCTRRSWWFRAIERDKTVERRQKYRSRILRITPSELSAIRRHTWRN